MGSMCLKGFSLEKFIFWQRYVMTIFDFFLSIPHFFPFRTKKKNHILSGVFILHSCNFRGETFFFFKLVLFCDICIRGLLFLDRWPVDSALNHMHTHTGIINPGLEIFFLALAPFFSASFLFFTIDDGLGQKNKQASEAGRRRRLMAARLGECMDMRCKQRR
ncbi:hypothetical protein GGI35DRAFT_149958 [Trichoderma velutinum]